MFRILVFLALVLSACGPSPAQLETAIAQTQAALPTATPIPPTATLEPTPTPKPKPLTELVLAHDSFPSDFTDLYDKNPIKIDTRLDIDVAVESVSFFYSADDAPGLIINLVRLQNAGQRVRVNRLLKENFTASGDAVKMPSIRVELPDDLWLVETNDDWVIAGWSNGREIALLEWERLGSVELETQVIAMALFIQAQNNTLGDQ